MEPVMILNRIGCCVEVLRNLMMKIVRNMTIRNSVMYRKRRLMKRMKVAVVEVGGWCH
jgi:hypothetical protein